MKKTAVDNKLVNEVLYDLGSRVVGTFRPLTNHLKNTIIGL